MVGIRPSSFGIFLLIYNDEWGKLLIKHGHAVCFEEESKTRIIRLIHSRSALYDGSPYQVKEKVKKKITIRL